MNIFEFANYFFGMMDLKQRSVEYSHLFLFDFESKFHCTFSIFHSMGYFEQLTLLKTPMKKRRFLFMYSKKRFKCCCDINIVIYC